MKTEMVPGTFVLNGQRAIYSTGATTVVAGDSLYTDPDIGIASMLKGVIWSFSRTGTQENIQDYPYLVKKYSLLRQDEESIGTNLRSSMELRAPNQQQTQALALGVQGRAVAADNAFVDFSHKFICGLNTAEATISSDINGNLIFDIQLQSNASALFGSSNTVNASYSLKNLTLEFEVIPDTGVRKDVMYIKHIHGQDQLLANETTLTNTVNGAACTGFLSTAINLTKLSDITANSYAAAPPAGAPPIGSTSTDTFLTYGIERTFYSIGNVDTVLTGYELTSREEIVGNALAAVGNMDKYGTLLRRMRHPLNPDGYVWGYLWKDALDLTNNSLTQYVKSLAGSPNPEYQVFTHYICEAFIKG